MADLNSLVAAMPFHAAVAQALDIPGMLGRGIEAATQTSIPSQITPPKSGTTTATMRDERLQENLSRPKAVAKAVTPGSSGSGAAPNMPGIMSPDVLMHPAVQQLLERYGITSEQLQSTVQNASPDLFITNPAAHANHPVLSGMAERALEGLAFTHGGNTVGESMSNIAQGMLTAQQARAEKYNNQLMMPFAQASQVANLQGTNLHQQYEDTEIKRANAQAEMYNQMPEYRQGLLDMRNRQTDDKVNTQRAMNHLKLQLMPEFSQLTSEHAQQFSTDLQKAGGDIGNLTDEQMEQYRQMGHADDLAAQTQSKIRVKEAPSGATGSRGRAGRTPEAAEYSAAGRDLGAFDKRYPFLFDSQATSVPDPDAKNNIIMRGGTRWKELLAKRAEKDARGQRAKAAYESQQQGMAIPGSGMSQQPVKRKVNSTGDHMMKVNGQWVPDPNSPR